MNNISENTFQNATGKIDYTLMNDYMFRAVLQENKKVLKGLIASLLHLSILDVLANLGVSTNLPCEKFIFHSIHPHLKSH